MKLLHNKMVGKHNIFVLCNHTLRASTLRHDFIIAKASCEIPKQSDWTTMISQGFNKVLYKQ